ncbi:hypothetical protein MLD38_009108 [Melastoma candidum]|uniref:Uncharacterized protein n=1 Tax=Melastoma candidum TaxID=119954 RepID=A0ACB9RWN8_9MYRT|nr:hypothetical protein MLD38_009108 [Melastoma candidum]
MIQTARASITRGWSMWGTAVIGLLFANKHFRLYPDLNTGTLTRLRANNVDTEKLARASIRHGLYRYLRHQKPLDEQVLLFEECIRKYPLHSNGQIDVPKTLADIVESSVGAVFVDSDSSLEAAWRVCQNLLEPMVGLENLMIHPTSELMEICQKHGVKMRFEDLWEETRCFDVFVHGELAGTGCHPKKKEVARCRAANNALPNVYRIIADKKAADAAGQNTDGELIHKEDAGVAIGLLLFGGLDVVINDW